MTVPVHGLPSLVREGLLVAAVPPALRGERWHRVGACSRDGRGGTLVSLSGVDDLSAAEALVGATLLAREADLPADLALHDAGRLVGRSVVDECGRTGTIAEVMRGPANDVWVVRDGDEEVLLPVIDSVVGEVPETGPIPVVVPAGLGWAKGGA